MKRPSTGLIAWAIAGTVVGTPLLPGCALKSDLDLTIDEVLALKRSQQQMQRELQIKEEAIEEGRSELSASQTEFRAGSESISQELARLAHQLSELQVQMDDVSHRIKELKNFQTIGLGSLSKRIDEGTETTQEKFDVQTARIDTQDKKAELFATKVSEQVDSLADSLIKLSKGVSVLQQSNRNRIAENKRLNTRLDELGKKLTGELKSQESRIAAGGDGGDVSALKQKVDVLGKKLPAAVDTQGKRIGAVQQELHDLQSLLSDLNTRLKVLEGR
ncbi:MAG: hypothetical protein ACE5FN_02855 [Leptospirillia bacterium]